MSSSNILSYASKLLPIFKKDRITDDARVVKTELNTNTIPSYENSKDLFSPRFVRSKVIEKYSREYFTMLGGTNSKGMVADIAFRLQSIENVVDVIADDAEKKFENSVIVDGMTLAKVSTIKALELCGFISRYSLRFLNYLYILETSASGANNDEYVSQQLSKGEIKEIELYFSDYCRSLKVLSKDSKNFLKDLDTLPNVTISPLAEATLANIGSTKLDPLNIFSLSGFISPVYRIGMMVAEMQVSRYKETKELKTNLELRRLYLESFRENGKFDEATQKEIDVIQSRIDRCTEQIRKTEEKVGM